MQALTASRVRELFSYDATSGALIRRVRMGAYAAGTSAGTPGERGYIRAIVDGKRCRVHRLVWLHVNGADPAGLIDHIDGNTTNNRIENLRVVDHQTNMQNQRSARSDNASGLLGVTWHSQPRKWRARITVDGKQSHLGHFETPELAHAAYLCAKRAVHAGCTI